MRRINTSWIVAFMENLKSIGYFSVRNLVAKTMGVDLCSWASQLEYTITKPLTVPANPLPVGEFRPRDNATKPRPAIICPALFDLAPKSLNRVSYLVFALTRSAAKFSWHVFELVSFYRKRFAASFAPTLCVFHPFIITSHNVGGK